MENIADQNTPDQPPDPAAALRRIAFLLERTLADTFKVKAFRGAAARVLATPPDELAELAAAGKLRTLEGIGKGMSAEGNPLFDYKGTCTFRGQ